MKPFSNGYTLTGSMTICCPEDEGGCGHVYQLNASAFHAVESTEETEGPSHVILVYECPDKETRCPKCNASFGSISIHSEQVDGIETGREIRCVPEYEDNTTPIVSSMIPSAEAQETLTLNLNQHIWVKLTEQGQEKLAEFVAEMDSNTPPSVLRKHGSMRGMFPTHGEHTRIQLHDLPTIFPGTKLDVYMDMHVLLTDPTGEP